MKLQKIKRIFFNWLKSKGAYEAYKLARHNMNRLTGADCRTHPYYRRHLIPHQFINHAFTWSLTYEGHDFWNRLNSEWRKYLKEIGTDSRYQ
jgi:hypothetical protein